MLVECSECGWRSRSNDNMAVLEFRYNHGPTKGHTVGRVFESEQADRFIYASAFDPAPLPSRLKAASEEYTPDDRIRVLALVLLFIVGCAIAGAFFLLKGL